MSYLFGHFQYQNRKLGSVENLAFSDVEIKDSSGNLMGIVLTDINGNFTFPINVPPSGINIRCTVYTKNDYATVLQGGFDIPYFANTDWISIQPGESKTITWVFPDDPYNPVFTVFSYHTGLNRGWYYLNGTTVGAFPNATARYPYWWRPQYDDTKREIWLTEYTYNYPDEILHEYSHYEMHAAFGWRMPPDYIGNYTIKNVSNQPTALTEGWAYFFPLAVKNNGAYMEWGSGGIPYSIDFESPHWCSPDWDDGDAVVGRVTGALWDIYDAYNDSYDTFTDGFNNIWNVINTAYFETFYHFWDIWNGSGYPKQPALMAIFQNSIDYRGPGDVNADGDVDGRDIAEITSRYGSWKGQPSFAQWADLNYDDKICGRDLALASSNYGKHYDC